VLFDLDKPHLYPRHDLVANLVHSARASDVTHVIVDGRVILRVQAGDDVGPVWITRQEKQGAMMRLMSFALRIPAGWTLFLLVVPARLVRAPAMGCVDPGFAERRTRRSTRMGTPSAWLAHDFAGQALLSAVRVPFYIRQATHGTGEGHPPTNFRILREFQIHHDDVQTE
jgi:hypothetical protein